MKGKDSMKASPRFAQRGALTVTIVGALMISLSLLTSCEIPNSRTEGNVSLVRSYFEDGINRGDTAVADALLTADFVKYNNGMKTSGMGPSVLKDAIESHKKNNADYRFTVEDIFADGDKVAVRWQWRSTNIKYGAPKEVTSHGISIFTIREGKIAELWQAFDLLSFNKQLEINQEGQATDRGGK
jgi:ketosteroid isomerase-like protein